MDYWRKKLIKPGELWDRLTIVFLENLMLNGYNEEFLQMKKKCKEHDAPDELILGLLICNASIWNLESDIRKGKDGDLELEDVGSRAIKIRDINKLRWKYKNAINSLHGFRGEKKADEWVYPLKYYEDFFAKEFAVDKEIVLRLFNGIIGKMR